MGIKSVIGKIGSALSTGLGELNDDPDKQRPYLKRKTFEPPNPLPDIEDAPPPTRKTTALEHAESLPSVRPTRPQPVDARAELGEAPMKKLEQLPDVPTRTPLDKSQTKGFKNRLKGAFEAAGNAGAAGATGLQTFGAMISGAVDREKANKQAWERNVELPEIQKRNARTKEIVAAQKVYDEGAKEVDRRNEQADKRYRSDFDQYKWAEELKGKALENEQKRRDTAAENEAKRKATSDQTSIKHKNALEMRDRWEKFNAEQKQKDRQSRLSELQVREREAMRREKFRADNNLERDFYKYTAESGDESETEPTPAEVDEALKYSPTGTTREQATADLKASKAKKSKSKPGAKTAAAKIAERFGGKWSSVPAGK